MELATLTMRGLTRFRHQIQIDFTALGPGVIAFTGPNGVGKTTVLEASGPAVLYHVLPSRSPSKLPAWTGPDGAKIHLTFRHAGDDYEATVRVARDGSQTATMSRNSSQLVTGKVRDFRALVSSIFGTREAFLASVFGSQGGAGRFDSLTVGERKAIFRWYLGLDALDRLRTLAGQRLEALDRSRLEALRGDLRQYDEVIKSCRVGIVEAKAGVREAKAVRDRAVKRGDQAKRYAVHVKLRAAYERALERVFDLEDQLEGLADDSPTKPSGDCPTDDELARAEAALAGLQERLEEYDRLSTELQRTRERFVHAEAHEVEIKERAAKAADVPCQARGKFAGCPLLLDAQEGEADLPVVTLATDDAAKQIAELERRIARIPDDLADRVRDADNDLEQKCKAKQRWELYVQQVRGHRREITEMETAIGKAKGDARAIYADIPDDLPSDLPTQAELDRILERQHQAQAMLDEATRTEAYLSAELARVTTDRRKAKEQYESLLELSHDLEPLDLLHHALGPDGVQAYEVAAAGPRVAGLANDLLAACYGPRFQLEVQTLRDLKTRNGQQEDFQIRVHDGRYGITHESIAGVSGGERVIVDEALRMALSLFATERAGCPFRTLYRDETIGGLDPDNAVRYVQLLHRARELGGFHQVLYVTHDVAGIEAADAVLAFDDDGRITVGQGA